MSMTPDGRTFKQFYQMLSEKAFCKGWHPDELFFEYESETLEISFWLSYHQQELSCFNLLSFDTDFMGGPLRQAMLSQRDIVALSHLLSLYRGIQDYLSNEMLNGI